MYIPIRLSVNPVYLRKNREKNCKKKEGFKSLFFDLDRKLYNSRMSNLHAEILRTRFLSETSGAHVKHFLRHTV